MAKLEMEEKLQSQTHTMQVALKKETNKLRKQLEAEYEKNSKSLLAEALENLLEERLERPRSPLSDVRYQQG